MMTEEICPCCGVDWNEIQADKKDLRLIRLEMAAKDRRIKELEANEKAATSTRTTPNREAQQIR